MERWVLFLAPNLTVENQARWDQSLGLCLSATMNYSHHYSPEVFNVRCYIQVPYHMPYAYIIFYTYTYLVIYRFYVRILKSYPCLHDSARVRQFASQAWPFKSDHKSHGPLLGPQPLLPRFVMQKKHLSAC